MKKLNKEYHVAIVVSRFNQRITDKLLAGAKSRLKALGFSDEKVSIYTVPGVVEIPLIAKKLAKSNQVDAILALGAVIRGETTHYDYVCQQVSDGVSRIMYDYELPVVFGVLTTENGAQAEDRVGQAHGHKGVEAVDCAIEMLGLLEKFKDKPQAGE